MQEKMQKFLLSIGIEEPELFALSFKRVSWNADRTKVLMLILVEEPWNPYSLQRFKEALGNINYDYEIAFELGFNPHLPDIVPLYEAWHLDFYRVGPDYPLEEEGTGLFIRVPTSEIEKAKLMAEEFSSYLAWLSYPYDLRVLPLEEEDEEKTDEEKTDDEEKEFTEERLRAEREYIIDLKAGRYDPPKKSWRAKTFVKYQSVRQMVAVAQGGAEIEGECFSKDFRPNRKGMLGGTMGLGDGHDGIYVRIFGNRSIDPEVLKAVKVGSRYRVAGEMEPDRNGELQLVASEIEPLPDLPLREDPYPRKRAELHLHTKMSTMDGAGDILDYCKAAKSMGLTALAVTDHGVIQSFPAAEAASKETGVKILYGTEFYMFDFPSYIMNPKDVLLSKARYCVFDFETTGLSSKYDRPTEFGGVIVENGLVVKRLDTFINPGIPIPKFIQEKTRITDEMVKDAPSIEEAVDIIEKFVGDAILVSHNATFDIGFLNAMRRRAGKEPISNGVIDTLDLSHYLFPEAARHSLGALSRNLDIQLYDEDAAHRADYDAEILNSVWQAILVILEREANSSLTHRDLGLLKCKNPKIFKHLRSSHIVALAKDQEGLKSLYRLISESHTTYLASASMPKIPREAIIREREHLLLGSACFNGEIFDIAARRSDEELREAMSFYDYIEIQPKENYVHLVNIRDLDEKRLMDILSSIVRNADSVGKMICATGDAHYVNPGDKLVRDVYIAATGLGGVLHPLRPRFREKLPPFENPDQHLRTTKEMIDSFSSWLPLDKAEQIVIDNPNKIADLIEPLKILKDKLYTPVSNFPGADTRLREICSGNLLKAYGENPDPIIVNRLEKELEGIIKNGYAVTYLIAHLIIKKAHEDGYMVGSRGSVGSSFAATMAGITEVNPLAPHYVCQKCHHFEWSSDKSVRSGFDLLAKKCPVCGCDMERNGQEIPFETFLGFSAEKVPDIDLNFPADYQSRAHAYARTLLSTPEENEKLARGETLSNPHVIRAGTIATAEEKNAIGYVKKYIEKVLGQDPNFERRASINYLGHRCVGVKRTTGQHPGGIVVIPSDMDIFDFTPFQHPADDPEASWLTTHYEFASMHDSVLKLDLLGHVDPMALRMMSLGTGVDINSIPLSDERVLSLFSSPKELRLQTNPLGFKTGAVSLPEFGTNFVQGILEDAKPKCFNDLLIISGISHGTDVWANNIQDLIRSKTGTLQEMIGCRDDIMRFLISKDMDPSMSFSIMEDVRKGRGLKDAYVAEMEKHDVPAWYIGSCQKIKYLFPRAHATAYVIGAFRVAHFKLYYPLQFYATYFTSRCDKFDLASMTKPLDEMVAAYRQLEERQNDFDFKDKDAEIMKSLTAAIEMTDRGYKIKKISIMESLASEWRVMEKDKCILPPFSAISGLGVAAGETVVEARKNGDFLSKEDLRKRTKLTESDIRALDELGCLEGLGESNQMSLFDFSF